MGVRQMPYQKGNGKPQYAGMGIGGSGSGGGSTYVLPKASADTLGGIKVGSRLSIDSDGVLSASDQSYSLPIASSEVLGGVKVGSGLSITNEGVLSVSGGGGIFDYSTDEFETGQKWIDNKKIFAIVIPFENVSSGSNVDVNLPANDFPIDKIIDSFAMAKYESGAGMYRNQYTSYRWRYEDNTAGNTQKMQYTFYESLPAVNTGFAVIFYTKVS